MLTYRRGSELNERLGTSYALVIDLSGFTPHLIESMGPEADDDPVYYTHPCRCSGTYLITTLQLTEGIEIIQCDGCSERCKVDYLAVVD